LFDTTASASSEDDPATLELKKLAGYELLEELGRGGMGVVYRARDPHLDREVALKVLSKSFDSRSRERFLRECQATARLQHPHIVRVHSAGEEGGLRYLVLDLVEGEPLAERLRRGTLPPATARAIAAKLADALAHAHQHGVLHRDLKPSNVLLVGDEPVLLDFGLARLQDASGLSRSGMLLGTPGFLAPEQARGEVSAVGEHTDVYGLGATLYAMLCGRPPVEGESLGELLEASAKGRIRPPSAHVEGVDRELAVICMRCLETDPRSRWGSCGALRDALLHGTQLRPGLRGVVGGLLLLALAASLVAAGLGWGRAPRAADTPAVPAPALPEPASATPHRLLRPRRVWSATHPCAGQARDHLWVCFDAAGRLHSLGVDGSLVRWSAAGTVEARSQLETVEAPRLLTRWRGAWFHAARTDGLRLDGQPVLPELERIVAHATLGERAAVADGWGGVFLLEPPGLSVRTVTPSRSEHGYANDLSFLAGGTRLIVLRASSWKDDTDVGRPRVELYALSSGERLAQLDVQGGRRVAVSPDGREVVVGFGTGGLWVLDAATLERRRDLVDPTSDDLLGSPHGGAIQTLLFAREGDRLYSLGGGARNEPTDALRVWSWPEGRPLARLELAGEVVCATLDPAGSRLAIGYEHGVLEVLALEDPLPHPPSAR